MFRRAQGEISGGWKVSTSILTWQHENLWAVRAGSMV
jgi:hypothetical protein